MDAKMFRTIVQVGDLGQALAFYATLLESEGRRVGGGRIYFDCGSMILALLNPGKKPAPMPESLYFAVSETELAKAHARATTLGCLSLEEVHGARAADCVTRPWGERSFYVNDPWGNGLCFVDEKTLFTGTQAR